MTRWRTGSRRRLWRTGSEADALEQTSVAIDGKSPETPLPFGFNICILSAMRYVVAKNSRINRHYEGPVALVTLRAAMSVSFPAQGRQDLEATTIDPEVLLTA